MDKDDLAKTIIAILQERVAALEDRQQELLATIRKLSSEIPYAEEANNTAVLIAEVGTLRARVAETERQRNNVLRIAEDTVAKLTAEVEEYKQHVREAYDERDRVIAENDQLRQDLLKADGE